MYVIVDKARMLAIGPFASRVEANDWLNLNDEAVVKNNDLKVIILMAAGE